MWTQLAEMVLPNTIQTNRKDQVKVRFCSELKPREPHREGLLMCLVKDGEARIGFMFGRVGGKDEDRRGEPRRRRVQSTDKVLRAAQREGVNRQWGLGSELGRQAQWQKQVRERTHR